MPIQLLFPYKDYFPVSILYLMLFLGFLNKPKRKS